MSKRISIIPGFTHKTTDPSYRWMVPFFRSKGFRVQLIKIDWQRHVMTDYAEQFRHQFMKDKADKNYVLGFSFGAMIALISSADLHPDGLYLCSLSPCFSEDLHHLSKNDAKIIGKRRIACFRKLSAQSYARQITCPTTVFCGGREAKRYPALINRCRQTVRTIKDSDLLLVPDAPHDIGHKSYVQTIKNVFEH